MSAEGSLRNLKQIASGNAVILKEVVSSTTDEYQWSVSPNSDVRCDGTLLKMEYRRGVANEQMTDVFLEYDIRNTGGVDIEMLNWFNFIQKFRVLINNQEVQDLSGVFESKYIYREHLLTSHHDDQARDNSYYSSNGVSPTLTAGELTPIVVPSGGSVRVVSQLSELTEVLTHLKLNKVSHIDLEFEFSSNPNMVSNQPTAPADLRFDSIKCFSRHKRFWGGLSPSPYSSWTVHHQETEVLRIPEAQHGFQNPNNTLDIDLHTRIPIRNFIQKIIVFGFDPSSPDSYRSVISNFIDELDLLRNGNSTLERHYDSRRKIFHEVSKSLMKHYGVHLPTNPSQAEHGLAWYSSFIDTNPVSHQVNHSPSQQVRYRVSEGISNSSNLVLRIRNGADVLPAGSELVVLVVYDRYASISQNGAVRYINN